MIKNYFTIAWRNLKKHKIYSLINVGGLAVGMTVAMLIGLWVWDEISFDRYHKNYNQIAQAWQFVSFGPEKSSYNSYRAKRFANTHFSCSFFTSRRAQVHKIDTGKQ